MKMCSGQNYTVAVVQHAAFMGEENDYVLNGPYSGIDYQILTIIARKLGFSYKTKVPKDRSWGTLHENASWSGMLGMLQRKEAHFAISTLSISNSRQSVAEFSFPYLYDSLQFITKAGGRVTTDQPFFLLPFSVSVWIWSLTSVMFSCLALVSLLSFPTWPPNQVLETLTIPIAILFKQAVRMKPLRSCSERTFLTVLLLGSTFLGYLYCGMLTSATSFRITNPEIDTMIDLTVSVLEHGYKVAVRSDSNYEELIKTSPEWPMPVIRNSLRPFSELERYEVFQKVLDCRLALIATTSFMFHLLGNTSDPSQYHFATENLYSDRIAVAFQKKFLCRNHFDLILQRILEVGLVERWRTKPEQYLITKEMEKSDDSMGLIVLDDIKKAVMLLSIGFLISGIVLAIEICIPRWLHWPKKL